MDIVEKQRARLNHQPPSYILNSDLLARLRQQAAFLYQKIAIVCQFVKYRELQAKGMMGAAPRPPQQDDPAIGGPSVALQHTPSPMNVNLGSTQPIARPATVQPPVPPQVSQPQPPPQPQPQPQPNLRVPANGTPHITPARPPSQMKKPVTSSPVPLSDNIPSPAATTPVHTAATPTHIAA